jgi:predicted  nucleic acid-binding Zn-ribbon protein
MKTNSKIQSVQNEIINVRNQRQVFQTQLEELHRLISTEEKNVFRLIIEKNNARTEFYQSQKGVNELSNKICQVED